MKKKRVISISLLIILAISVMTSFSFGEMSKEEMKELELLEEKMNSGEEFTEQDLEKWVVLLEKDAEDMKIETQKVMQEWRSEFIEEFGDMYGEEALRKFKKEKDPEKTLELGKKMHIEKGERAALVNLYVLDAACKSCKGAEGSYPQSLKALGDAYPPYIDSMLASGIGTGYSFQFTSKENGYIIIAIPIRYGLSGIRKFFLDETGIIRFTADGTEPSANSEQLP